MSERTETFSYLPPLNREQAMALCTKLLHEECVPMVEYLEAPQREDMYWHIWPLPRKPLEAEQILALADQCHRTHPFSHVRISGYNAHQGRCTHCFTLFVPQVV